MSRADELLQQIEIVARHAQMAICAAHLMLHDPVKMFPAADLGDGEGTDSADYWKK